MPQFLRAAGRLKAIPSMVLSAIGFVLPKRQVKRLSKRKANYKRIGF